MEDLFAAVDISGVASNVGTLMIGFVGIGLLFFGYHIVKKLISRGA